LTIQAAALESSSTYELHLPKTIPGRVAHVAAKINDAHVAVEAGDEADESFVFSLALPEGASAGDEVTIKAAVYRTHALRAFPETMTQLENQWVVLATTSGWLSPYATDSVKTTVKLGTSRTESWTRAKPSSKSGDSIVYGPYTGVAAGDAGKAVEVHYENNAPFLVMHDVLREVEVSHWGNVAVEEEYTLWNMGSTLVGGFSRADLMLRQAKANSLTSMTATLPADASDPYYRDIIGNVTTSNFRNEASKAVLEIQPRFPLYGGWKTQWYQGYNLPLQHYVSVLEDGSYALKVDFSIPYDNVAVDDITVKVVLPETATVLAVDTGSIPVRQSGTKRYTYLDSSSSGRPVIILQASNLVKQSNAPLVVRYVTAPMSTLREPMMLISSFFLLFLVIMVLVRLNFSLAAPAAQAAASDAKKQQ
jgi:oligosaccharyltransferase complex subunit alpha (ribophorin I)